MEDFPDQGIRLVKADGMEIGVIRWRGRLYAARNVCPHASGPVCQGRVVELLESDAGGELVSDPDRPVLTCAWHEWEFDLNTGKSLFEPGYKLKMYPVEAVDGQVRIRLPGGRLDLPGPDDSG